MNTSAPGRAVTAIGRESMRNIVVENREADGTVTDAIAPVGFDSLVLGRVATWWYSRFGWRLLAEFGVMYGLLTVYRAVRTVKKTDLMLAFSHSADVIQFQNWLGLPSEVSVQQAVLAQPHLIDILNRYYVWIHFPSIFVLVIWLYLRHPDVYRPIRSLLTVVTFMALVIHLSYPLAPPRMMESFVDTVQIYGPSVYPPNSLNGVANQIAAMPSLHFGWAAIEAMAVIWAFKSRWRWLIIAHPIIMVTAIVATANHWWMDAIVAGGLILAGLPLAAAIEGWFDKGSRNASDVAEGVDEPVDPPLQPVTVGS